MREAWSEQKERKMRKEERREKKDAKKKYEWELEQANGEEDRQSDLVNIAKAQVERKKRKEREEKGWDEEMGKEYKSLKREIKEEKSVNKSSKGGAGGGGIGGGMFDDLE